MPHAKIRYGRNISEVGPGITWMRRFKKRHPEFKFEKSIRSKPKKLEDDSNLEYYVELESKY